MTQVFDVRGEIVPVTIIEAGPCLVTQIKTVEHDQYAAVQLGFEQVEARRLNKPLLGHLGEQPSMRVLREVREINGVMNSETSILLNKAIA